MSTKCSSEPSPVAFCLLFRLGIRRSPTAGGEISLRKETTARPGGRALQRSSNLQGREGHTPGRLLLPLRGNSPSAPPLQKMGKESREKWEASKLPVFPVYFRKLVCYNIKNIPLAAGKERPMSKFYDKPSSDLLYQALLQVHTALQRPAVPGPAAGPHPGGVPPVFTGPVHGV